MLDQNSHHIECMQQPMMTILDSPSVSPQTRRVLKARLPSEAHKLNFAPKFFIEEEFQFLELLAQSVLPQIQPETTVPFAQLIDDRLTRGEGSGWRYADLPPEPEAYRIALRKLGDQLTLYPDGAVPVQSTHILAVLEQAQQKQFDTSTFVLSLWLEGFKAELTRYWLSSPETMALMQYEGFADELLKPQEIALATTQEEPK